MIRILKFLWITYRYHLLCCNFVFSLVNHTSALCSKSAFLAKERCHNGDGNKNVRKALGLFSKQNNNTARAAHFLVHFCTVPVQIVLYHPLLVSIAVNAVKRRYVIKFIFEKCFTWHCCWFAYKTH